jgi:ABC-type amino acid transport system permease subunit
MFSGLLLESTTFNAFAIFTEIAIIYFVICYPLALLEGYLEYRLNQVAWGTWGSTLRRAIPGLRSS